MAVRSFDSQPRVDRFAFQSEDAENALVSLAEWFAMDEPLQPFEAQSKFTQREPPFGSD
jgi:hypothetical protein